MNIDQYKDIFDGLANGNTSDIGSFFGGALGGVITLFAGFVIIFLLIALAVLVVKIIAQWKLYVKAGEAGWKAIIPYYNTFVLVKIAGLNWWYFLIAIAGTIFGILGISLGALTALLSLAVNFFIFYNLAKKFEKNEIVYAIFGAIVPGIMIMILGFNKNAIYNSGIEVSPNGPIK